MKSLHNRHREGRFRCGSDSSAFSFRAFTGSYSHFLSLWTRYRSDSADTHGKLLALLESLDQVPHWFCWHSWEATPTSWVSGPGTALILLTLTGSYSHFLSLWTMYRTDSADTHGKLLPLLESLDQVPHWFCWHSREATSTSWVSGPGTALILLTLTGSYSHFLSLWTRYRTDSADTHGKLLPLLESLDQVPHWFCWHSREATPTSWVSGPGTALILLTLTGSYSHFLSLWTRYRTDSADTHGKLLPLLESLDQVPHWFCWHSREATPTSWVSGPGIALILLTLTGSYSHFSSLWTRYRTDSADTHGKLLPLLESLDQTTHWLCWHSREATPTSWVSVLTDSADDNNGLHGRCGNRSYGTCLSILLFSKICNCGCSGKPNVIFHFLPSLHNHVSLAWPLGVPTDTAYYRLSTQDDPTGEHVFLDDQLWQKIILFFLFDIWWKVKKMSSATKQETKG